MVKSFAIFSFALVATAARAAPFAEQVLAPQLADQGGLALAGEPLLGRFGLSVAEVLAELAPHLQPCVPRLTKSTGVGLAVHEYYDLYLGQFWSAVLWELRGQLGAAAGDQLVYQSLAYMGPTSGMRDAFLALLSADRDLAPLPADQPEAKIYGANKCRILGAGVARGFAEYLGAFNGQSCGLDLATLAELSRDKATGKTPPPKGGSQAVTLFGRTCSVVAGHGRAAPAGGWLLAVPALLAALGGVRRRRRGRQSHGP